MKEIADSPRGFRDGVFLRCCRTTLALAAGLAAGWPDWSPAQNERFYRIAAPTNSRITGFAADGMLTWTGGVASGNFTVLVTDSPKSGAWFVNQRATIPGPGPVKVLLNLDPTDEFRMVQVPAGTGMMGDSLDLIPEALPPHELSLSAFWMDKTPVTKGYWYQVYAWGVARGYMFENPGEAKGDDSSVLRVNWYDAVKWCNARSEMEGRIPVYYTNISLTAVYRSGAVDLGLNHLRMKTARSGYRLPTEAEWEKAARGGVQGLRFPWGDTIDHSRANYRSSENYWYDVSPTRGFHPVYSTGLEPHTSAMASFAPNAYGLYDLVGNAYQWCWDRFDSYYYTNFMAGAATDPLGPETGSYRSIRGGSWTSYAPNLRCAFRTFQHPTLAQNVLGFRCARSLDIP